MSGIQLNEFADVSSRLLQAIELLRGAHGPAAAGMEQINQLNGELVNAKRCIAVLEDELSKARDRIAKLESEGKL